MKELFKTALEGIEAEEQKLTFENSETIIQESYQMIQFLMRSLNQVKKEVKENDFINVKEEIEFFKIIKPNITCKILFYHDVIDIVSLCPSDDPEIKKEYYKKQKKKYCCADLNLELYKYIKTQRTDKDEFFFTRDLSLASDLTNAFFFEVDVKFFTKYSFQLAKIKGRKLLMEFISNNLKEQTDLDCLENPSLEWLASKNSLIELIYALHISQSVSHKNIREIVHVFESVFNIELGDVHHSFYKMKFRSNSYTLFLDRLRVSLENHMMETA